MNADAAECRRIAIRADRRQPVDKIGRCVGIGQRVPAQPVWRRRRLVAWRGAQEPTVDLPERLVHRRRADAVEPRAPVLRSRRGERAARQLLGVEPARRRLRRVLPLRQGAGNRLALLLVAKAGEVIEARAWRLDRAAPMHLAMPLADLDPRIRAHHSLPSTTPQPPAPTLPRPWRGSV